MLELSALAVAAGATWFWIDSLRARERAVRAGRAECGRHGLQFLDETVAIVKLRPARDDQGRLRLRRTYAFEFSDTGNNRRQGVIVTLGGQLADVQLEPYRIQ
ncbi:MAG TPA: DUF3301 domain-containing protein [Burkholderiales bacterium]|jgi:hypothetical protein|nr:DUF3301 domain-containing protein [Burkholderiales bacterium]